MATPAGGPPPDCLPRKFYTSCVLLLLAEGSSHGYELLERLRGLGVDKIDSGALYRALRSMEQDGLARSWWESSESGPARRTYELTDDGVDSLHLWADSVRSMHEVVEQYLVRYEAVVDDASVSTP